jgi:CBS domain-containing protein
MAEEDVKEEVDSTAERVATLRKVFNEGVGDTLVSALKFSRDAVVFRATMSVTDALSALVDHHLRCAPVRSDKEWVGVLDIRDSLKFVVADYREHHKADDDDSVKEFDAVLMSAYLTQAIVKTTHNLSYFARMRSLSAIFDTESIAELASVFGRGSHIISVVGRHKKSDRLRFKGILSQGDAFRQMCEHMEEFLASDTAKAADMSIGDLMAAKVAKTPVISIGSDSRAIDVFDKMSKRGLSGIAVVDAKTGALKFNTSSSDVKLWLKSSASLDLPIGEFLRRIRKSDKKKDKSVGCLTTSDTLLGAISKLRTSGYHRLWIVDDDTKPIGVLSITDIMRLIAG